MTATPVSRWNTVVSLIIAPVVQSVTITVTITNWGTDICIAHPTSRPRATNRWRCDECACRRGSRAGRAVDGSRRRSRNAVGVVRLHLPSSECRTPADGLDRRPAVDRHGSLTPTAPGRHRSAAGWRRLTSEWRMTSSCSVCSRTSQWRHLIMQHLVCHAFSLLSLFTAELCNSTIIFWTWRFLCISIKFVHVRRWNMPSVYLRFV